LPQKRGVGLHGGAAFRKRKKKLFPNGREVGGGGGLVANLTTRKKGPKNAKREGKMFTVMGKRKKT